MHLNLFVSHKAGGYQENDPPSINEINEKSFIKVSENDYIYIYLISNSALGDDSGLWLTEDWFPLRLVDKREEGFLYEVEFSSLFPQGENFYKYIFLNWLGGESKRFAKVFLNYFGSCEIFFDRGDDSLSPNLIGKLEISSSKINEVDIDNIFDFLLGNKVSYWQAISRSKVKSSGNYFYDGHIFWLLYQLKDDLSKFLKVFPQFEVEPRTRVVEKNLIVNWSDNLTLDESSVVWLLHNCHVLERTDQYDSERIRINNKFYNVNQIQTQNLINDTNLYENKVIHGYLYDIKLFLYQHLQDIDNSIPKKTDRDLTLRELQISKYFQRLKKDCLNLLYTTDKLINNCQRVIPVSEPLVEFPNNFQGFESKDHYYQIGTQIINWFNKKNLIYDSNFLFSGVRTLDKLYELFCLFKIIEAIEEFGFSEEEFLPVQASKTKWDDRVTIHAGKYIFKKADEVGIILYYEQLPKYLYTSSSVYKRELLPDFILEIRRSDGKADIIILDAKYKPYSNIKRYDLSELTLKYLHGLSSNSTSAQVKGLFLLHPKDKFQQQNNAPLWSYHKDHYNIFSASPILPAIGTIEVSVGKFDSTQLVKVLKRMHDIK